jgi:hypothetical protein
MEIGRCVFRKPDCLETCGPGEDMETYEKIDMTFKMEKETQN